MMKSIAVYGMTCPRCEAKVQTTAMNVSGVLQAQASHKADQLELEGDFSSEALGEAIEAAGYQLVPPGQEPESEAKQKPEKVSAAEQATLATGSSASSQYLLDINGMSCASCVRSVEQALQHAPGVESASVNYAAGSAFVATSGSFESLTKAVTSAGYGASLREDQSAANRDAEIKHRFGIGLFRSGIALAVGTLLMINMHLGLLPGNQTSGLVTGLIVLGIMIFSGSRYFRGAVTALKYKQTTMDTLIALGTGTAWLYSMLVVVRPELFPAESRHLFFESALFVIGFVGLGKALEEFARGKTSLALQKLVDLAPATACRLTADGEEIVPISMVLVGDRLLVRSGEIAPVDGVIEKGQGTFDEAMLTGESMPVEKSIGDEVTGGTISMDGVITLEASQVGQNTVLARMVEAVKEAQNSKPAIAELTDRIAAVFVPFVIVLAVLALLFWLWLVPGMSHGLTVFMSVLIVACPCAMGLAIPMSITVGIGRGASNGILIKNSDALQRANSVDTLVLDKTGTLTMGKPVVTEVLLNGGAQLNQFGAIAKSLEVLSKHPLAMAIGRYFDTATSLEVENFETLLGGGVRGVIDGADCLIGSLELARKEGCSEMKLPEALAGTLVCVVRNRQILGVVVLKDELRPEAKNMIDDVRKLGIRTIMLSGDRNSVVASAASELRLDESHGEMLPEEKAAFITRLQSEGHKVAMVGDGINDSLALSCADVGFAMADGVDIAIESADIALLSGNLSGIPSAILLSRRVMTNIKQNLFAAFGYNIVLIPIAAGALYPWTGQLLDPAFAGVAMAASSISVVGNAVRLRFMA
jgi:Cu+-exporting ATPase